MRYCPDLVVISSAKYRAEHHLISADLAFATTIKIHDIAIDILRNNRSAVFGSGRSQYDQKVAFCLHAQVPFDITFKRTTKCPLISALDGVHVCVRTTEQNVVQDFLFGARSFHGTKQRVAVMK